VVHDNPQALATPSPPGMGSFYDRFVKRSADALIAGGLLILLLPVLLLVWAAVVVVLGYPAFYFDRRAGRRGVPIVIGKFRSMSEAVDRNGVPLSDAERLGGFGRFLRRTSLDELPQLLSVLTGDMSLIGPRPLPLRYVARYNSRQIHRLDVRPGLTGLAQVWGRNGIDWPTRLELDVRYVEVLSRWYAPLMDLGILGATIGVVVWQGLTGRGISGAGSVTMKEFEP
jgi:lipopolysaccharide/colanic/teichoic acid biosynthesis glycosyltransferase